MSAQKHKRWSQEAKMATNLDVEETRLTRKQVDSETWLLQLDIYLHNYSATFEVSRDQSLIKGSLAL